MKQLRLESIKAVAHPEGNRVDVQWLNPEPHQFNWVRVMRRESTYPTSPYDEKYKVADVKNEKRFDIDINDDPVRFKNDLDNKTISTDLSDRFLIHQVVLSPQAVVSVVEAGHIWKITGEEQIYFIVKNNKVLDVYLYSIDTAADEGLRSEVVYYYAFFPYKSDPGDPAQKEFNPYDRSNCASAMATGPYDFAGQMFRMLPAIYHRYDTALHLRRFLDLPGTQLDQLYSFAAAALDFQNIHRVDGALLSLLAQWIGWDTDYNLELAAQRNELRNAPFMYQTIGTIPNIEAAVVKCINGWETRTKEFVHNIFFSNRPEQLNLWLCRRDEEGRWVEPGDVFSLDFAYEGRPAVVKENTGTLWLFYHTRRNNRWEIWCKTRPQEEKWTPSVPVTSAGTGPIEKHPTAAVQSGKLWVAWDSFNPGEHTWQIKYRGWTGEEWTDTEPFYDEITGTPTQRKSPQLVVDSSGRLWFFWLEKAEGIGKRWQMKYNRTDGVDLEFHPSRSFPPGIVEKDLFVLYQEGGEPIEDNIWVFWTRKQANGTGGRKYWEIAYRKLSNLDSAGEEDWGPIHVLPKDAVPGVAGYNDCEPAAVIYKQDDNDVFELYWSSNRTGSWSLWKVQINSDTGDSSAPVIIISNPYSQRTPLPLLLDDGISLLYRSNRGISYRSENYGATVTTDLRYAGCTTVDIRDEVKVGLWRKYEDFQTYTYDTGKKGKPTDDDWYTRDTIGLYLTPDTEDQQLIIQNRELVKGVLERFLPIQTRAVFVINPPAYKELIYTYDSPKEDAEDPRHIIEQVVEERLEIGAVTEEYPEPGVRDEHEDTIPQWTWLRSVEIEDIGEVVDVKYTGHTSVDFDDSPIDTKSRTVHTGLKGNIKEEKK